MAAAFGRLCESEMRKNGGQLRLHVDGLRNAENLRPMDTIPSGVTRQLKHKSKRWLSRAADLREAQSTRPMGVSKHHLYAV